MFLPFTPVEVSKMDVWTYPGFESDFVACKNFSNYPELVTNGFKNEGGEELTKPRMLLFKTVVNRESS